MATAAYTNLAHRVSEFAAEQGEWAGAPLPIEQFELTVARRYSLRGLEGATTAEKEPEPDNEPAPDIKLINSWWSWRKKSWVYLIEENGRRTAFPHDTEDCYLYRFNRILKSIDVTTVQDHQAELTARDKLKSLISDHLFAMYVLQDCFLETSKRSGITYLFRKSRPTLAISWHGRKNPSVIAALCMHPIGYYVDSFYGAMVPTDEVISHLLLMRADEHRYWRTANQHAPWCWQSGI